LNSAGVEQDIIARWMVARFHMYGVIWTYRVKDECRDAFIDAYSSEGLWVQLFRRAEGFHGTELLCCDSFPNSFMTIDRWDSKNFYEHFIENYHDQYKELDKRCADLTLQEDRVGAFEHADEIAACKADWEYHQEQIAAMNEH
jgi:hypothetical protein